MNGAYHYWAQPLFLDCTTCVGRGEIYDTKWGVEKHKCPTCANTGLIAIPFAEVINLGRRTLDVVKWFTEVREGDVE